MPGWIWSKSIEKQSILNTDGLNLQQIWTAKVSIPRVRMAIFYVMWTGAAIWRREGASGSASSLSSPYGLVGMTKGQVGMNKVTRLSPVLHPQPALHQKTRSRKVIHPTVSKFPFQPPHGDPKMRKQKENAYSTPRDMKNRVCSGCLGDLRRPLPGHCEGLKIGLANRSPLT